MRIQKLVKVTMQRRLVLCCLLILLGTGRVRSSLVRQTLGSYPRAVCTDGSPAAYYHTAAFSEHELRHYSGYVIYLDGGGYCPSVRDCHLRCSIARNLCTEPLAETKESHGILSDDVSNNPVMHDYYKVELPYCTSDMFVGRRKGTDRTEGLNFAGKIVFDAMITSLKRISGIAHAQNVVLSGSSAGGAGVVFLCEHLQRLLPRTTVWCVADAAFFYPMTSPFRNDTTCESIDKVLQQGASLWGAPEVGHFRLQSWWNDLLPTTRLFLGIAKFDVFGFESFCGDFNHPEEVDEWGEGIFPMTLRLLTERPDFGLFSAACRYHMILHSNSLFNRLKVGPAKLTYADALENWMKGKPRSSYQVWDICPRENFCNSECDNADGVPEQEAIERGARDQIL
ncbi:hypothetical protein CAPTEDRAFT_219523 [Capitella teleta]|uniref:Pectin acetylesterase n=1 Tax=Capitella teleta TaxID=283909 RepID=R7TSQ9_CAPTE|nr:hypothetical protein CAPTEDRAFT_219523 [Capitella teleta]|eukprot:ELT96642.1 hypothetical protein CAPTEDRAFT_219523 [Capitella teleta]